VETLVIQSGVKHGRIAEVTRSNGARLRIGRGYDNDIVLTDRHVAPRQVEFFRAGEHWHLRVLDRTNPVFLNDRQLVGETPRVHPGDTLSLGRTHLSIHTANQPVDRTHKLVLAHWLARDSLPPYIPVAALALLALLDLALTWLESSTSLTWTAPVYGQLVAVVIVVAWAGLWAVAGRVARHQPHFGLQLIAAACVMLLTSVLVLGAEYLAYPFHDRLISEAFYWAALFTLMALLLHLNLVIATNLLRVRVAALAMSALLVTVLYGFNVFSKSEADPLSLPDYSRTLAPPPLSTLGAGSAETYFTRVAGAMERLAREQ